MSEKRKREIPEGYIECPTCLGVGFSICCDNLGFIKNPHFPKPKEDANKKEDVVEK